MTEGMKHRLVGAAVLVALGIVFWPVVFDSSPVREISQRSQIPSAPPVERFEIDPPERPQMPAQPNSAALRSQLPGAPDVGETQPQTQPAQSVEAVPEPKQVEHDDFGLPLQWAVQLGVFSRQEGALEIKKRAEAAGFHAILQKDGEKYRVYAGPQLDQEAASRLKEEVRRKLGIEAFVTRYYP